MSKCGNEVCFHGAFHDKAAAVRKEQSTPGAFIKGVLFAPGDYRYLVLTRNKQETNPMKKPKRKTRRNASLVDAIRPGDRVTIITRHGQQRTGRAVMRSSTGGWVLNMGGAHGTPGLADEDNIVNVKKKKNPARRSQATAQQRVVMKRQLRGAGIAVPSEISTDRLKKLYRKIVGESAGKKKLLRQYQIVSGAKKNPQRRARRRPAPKPAGPRYAIVKGSKRNPAPIISGLTAGAAAAAVNALSSHFGKGHKVRKVRIR